MYIHIDSVYSMYIYIDSVYSNNNLLTFCLLSILTFCFSFLLAMLSFLVEYAAIDVRRKMINSFMASTLFFLIDL